MQKLTIITAGLLVAAAPGAAQSTDALVQTITTLARDNLGSAILSDGRNVPPETPAERARPLVPAALEIQTVRRGALTAQLLVCGKDGEQVSYLPYMAELRASRRYSEKQLAYISLVHGITQGMVHGSLSERPEPCPGAARTAALAALARPISKP